MLYYSIERKIRGFKMLVMRKMICEKFEICGEWFKRLSSAHARHLYS